jgi:hypothetical protein
MIGVDQDSRAKIGRAGRTAKQCRAAAVRAWLHGGT